MSRLKYDTPGRHRKICLNPGVHRGVDNRLKNPGGQVSFSPGRSCPSPTSATLRAHWGGGWVILASSGLGKTIGFPPSPPYPPPTHPLPARPRARSDGGLAGDALGAALAPGFGVLPGAGVDAGNQALPAETATAARPAPLPGAARPLAPRTPEGRPREGHRRMLQRKPIA